MNKTNDVSFIRSGEEVKGNPAGEAFPQVEYDLPLHAVGWRIVVRPNQAKTHSEGGIALPVETTEVQDANQYLGVVVSVGPLAYMDPAKFAPNGKLFKPWCKVGDVVAFNKYGGQKLSTAKGEAFRILNDEDVLANITDPDAMYTPY